MMGTTNLQRPGRLRSGGKILRGVTLGLCASLAAAACTSGGSPTTGGAGAAGVDVAAVGPAIPQPTVEGLTVAPSDVRVDLEMPAFSDPTRITNPWFPVSSQASVLMLGRVDGQPFRTEVTLLPETRIIEWGGQRVETLVSQYTAYLGGRIHEVAYDFYAQADDGSVWYFGEDVFNFADGAIVDTHGTWIAGKDGPAAMIMPAAPRVGDVYRPENIPGFVFEEVTVQQVDAHLDGPIDPVAGGVVIRELHMDGATEAKSFAPGYGEFYTAGGGDVEALALAVPTDQVDGAVPDELLTLHDGARTVIEAAASGGWGDASSTVADMRAAWRAYVGAHEVPRMLRERLDRDLAALATATRAQRDPDARQASIGVAQSALDLSLRYRPVAEVDVARFQLWTLQLRLDADRGDAAAVNGDLFTLDYIRDRIADVLDADRVTRLHATMEALQTAVGDGDLAAAARVAARLHDVVG